MRKLIILIISSMTVITVMQGQSYGFADGSVTMDELTMQSFTPDPSAGAVIIFDEYKVNYRTMSQRRDYFTKVKILNASQLHRGIVSIVYYSPEDGIGETVSHIYATCYNESAGKIVKSKLNPKEVLTEDIGDGYKVIYFAVPDVEVGSVVEYGYRINVRGPQAIPTVEIQKDIPVIRSKLSVTIPYGFRFAAVIRGTAPVSSDNNLKTWLGYSEQVVPFEQFHEYVWTDVPAFSEEPYIWNRYDIMVRCDFQVISNDDGKWVYDLTPSWKDITADLKEVLLPDKIYVPSSLSAKIDSLSGSLVGNRAAIGRIHRLMTEEIKWNNTYNLYPENPDSVLKAGVGGSGDINYILLSALRHAGFTAEPVFLRPRSMGRLPLFTYAEDIAAFIVRVRLTDGTFVCVDGTDPHLWVNMLPEELMTDRARLLYADSLTETWVDLSRIGRNRVAASVNGSITGSGILECEVNEIMEGMPAYSETVKYLGQLFEGDYVRSIESDIGSGIGSFSFKSDSSAVIRKYNFSRQLVREGGKYILPVNPVAGKRNNPIRQDKRLFPFEFSWPVEYVVNVNITFPEYFNIHSIPENAALSTSQKGIGARMLYSLENGVFRASFVFRMDRIFYDAGEKDQLYTFFRTLLSRSMETVELSAGTQEH